MALRDSKLRLVAQLRLQAQHIQEMQLSLPAHLQCPLPALPTLAPEETPEKRLQPSRGVLERFRRLSQQRWARAGQGRLSIAAFQEETKDGWRMIPSLLLL